ncbi:hypothetical protein [Roseovarius atlanticus]|uniref:hypothetical protein n=1 Tax=Roseovarius atlanticus TaxID=1641875 RepID=UPI001C93E7EF|nr:hypothetical protein [Roseovarius atlanticus]MBY5986818.1 hypothetical protein [Roseovarius atlanticus]MBY6125458.1 hypothetical protein [Roseovarius atlanticus]MBY6150081.1 hypothetical protein [Roseovarius atlanticus]
MLNLTTAFFMAIATAGFAADETGTWEGHYSCGSIRDVDLTFDASNKTATFAFYQKRRHSAEPVGKYELDYTRDGSKITATPRRWVDQPKGWGMVGFTGDLRGSATQITGTIASQKCGPFAAKKVADTLVDPQQVEAEAADAAPSAPPAAAASDLSAFAGMDLDINDVPLGYDFETTVDTAFPGGKRETRTWYARSGANKIGTRQEFAATGFYDNKTPGVKESVVVYPTHWHTGQVVYRVERSIRSSNEKNMPTEESLVAAAIAKYGEPINRDAFVQGAGGLGASKIQLLEYPIKDGKIQNVLCDRGKSALAHKRIGKNPREEYQEARNFLDRASNAGYCDAVLVVTYSVGRHDRLRSYSVIARDLRLEAMNIVGEVEATARLIEEFENTLPEVEPEL